MKNALKVLKSNRSLVIGFFVIVLIISLTSLVVSLFRPMTMDETYFFVESSHVAFEGNLVSHALWHPPVYLYMLGGAINLFNGSLLSGRILGLLFYFANYLLLVLIIRKLFEKKKANKIALIFSFIYFLSPLLLQQSLLVDIDTSILPTFVFIFILAFVSLKENFMKYIILAGLFALALAAKLTPTPVLVLAVFAYFFLNRKYIKAFTSSIFVFVLGTGIFWSVWVLWSKIVNLDRYFFLNLTLERVLTDSSGFSLFQYARQVIFALTWDVFWLSLPFFIILVFLLVDRTKQYISKKKLGFQDFIIFTALFAFLIQNFIRPTGAGMKYQYFAYCLFSFAVAIYVYGVGLNKKKYDYKLLFKYFLGVGLTSIFLGLVITKNFLVNLSQNYFYSSYVSQEIIQRNISQLPNALLLIGVVLLLSAALIFFSKKIVKLKVDKIWMLSILLAAFLIYYLGIGDVLLSVNNLDVFQMFLYLLPIILTITIVLIFFEGSKKALVYSLFCLMLIIYGSTLVLQTTSSYTTAISWTNYGESGFTNTVDFVKQNTDENQKVIIRNDLGFYVDRDYKKHNWMSFDIITDEKVHLPDNNENLSFFATNLFYQFEKPDYLYNDLMNSYDIKYIIIDQYSRDTYLEKKIQESGYVLERKIGDFDIYTN